MSKISSKKFRSSLAAYVKKRNGVALGGKNSMRNMLHRSFGEDSFAGFWRHWNPIWSYYLSRHVMRPVHKHVGTSVAILMTFLVSGALHDIAVALVKFKPVFFFTPWFGLMGILVLMTSAVNLRYQNHGWWLRALINLLLVTGPLMFVIYVEQYLLA